MKNTVSSGKIAPALALALLLAAAPAFSQTPNSLGSLKEVMDEFSGNMAKSLPFNSSMGLNWSESHIKKFPHFGAGVALGYTTMKADGFGKLLDQFGFSLPVDLGGFPLPGYSVEGRLGGFFLPFDVGFKFGYMPMKPQGLEKWDYFLIGGDVRYAVVNETIFLPMVSVGVGFNYLNGALSQSAGDDRKFNYPDTSNGNSTETLTLGKPTLTVDWATASIDLKAQISKHFILLTPYFGVGASNGWSQAGYKVETAVTSTGDIAVARQFAKDLGIDMNDVGFSSSDSFTGWSFRMYGGFSFNMAIIRLDLTGLFNFVDLNYGVTLGVRVQL